MEKRDKPSFYGILPASVRYDKRVKPMARILFADITALANAKGYCNASNKTLGEWHEVAPETASRWVSNLKKTGHIEIVEIKEGKNIIERRIYPISNAAPIDKKINRVLTKTSKGYCQKDQDPIDKNVKENNTSKNITSININKCVNTQNTPPQEPDEIERPTQDDPIITVTDHKEKRKKVAAKKEKFIPPTETDAANYAEERIREKYPEVQNADQHAESTAEDFINYYGCKNWMVGRTKMKNWKFALNRWIKNNYQENKYNLSYGSANNKDARFGAAKISDIKQALFELDQEKREGVFF